MPSQQQPNEQRTVILILLVEETDLQWLSHLPKVLKLVSGWSVVHIQAAGWIPSPQALNHH